MNSNFTRLNSLNPALRPAIRRFGLRANPPFPHFIGLGTQKGGTTSLYWYLRQHPGIHLPEPKELQYFSLHGDRGAHWYGQCFEAARPGQVRGEITPYYLFHPHAAQRIRELVPDVKLIVLLRDPVERTLSHYFHACRLGFETRPLQEALLAEQERLQGSEQLLKNPGSRHLAHQRHSYLSRSRYDQQIPRYQSLFKPEQLLVLRSEDLRNQPIQTLETVTNFLGLPRLVQFQSPAFDNRGGGEAEQVSAEMREQLRRQLTKTTNWCSHRLGLNWNGCD